MSQPTSLIAAGEYALVDAQVLLQQAMNEKFGNPRDCEEENPKKTAHLFRRQYQKLAGLLGSTQWKVQRFFSDDSKLSVKDLAASLYVLGYQLDLTITPLTNKKDE